MPRTRHLLTAAVALFAVATAPAPAAGAPAPAAGRNITLPYPARAPLVVHVNGLVQARDRLNKMLEALPEAEAKAVKEELASGLDELLAGRKLTAVPAAGRVFLVVHDFATLGDGDPAVAVLVPVTDYKAFKDSFLTADERKTAQNAGKGIESVQTAATGEEKTLYMAQVKGYVALTPNMATAETYAGKYTPAQSGALGTDLSSSFLNADVSLLVNMDVVNDLYGEQIRQFKGLIDFGLGQAEQGGMLPGLNRQQIEMLKEVLNGFAQAIEDSRGLVIAAEFRPEGLNVRAQVRFAEETTSADVLKPETPGPLADISRLPRGLSTYGGSKFGKKFTELAQKMGMQFAAGDDDQKGAEVIRKQLGEIVAAGSQGDFSAMSMPDRSITITRYANPKQAAGAFTKLYQAMASGGRFSNIVLKEKPRVAEAAQKHRGFTFTEVRLHLDFEATVEGLPDPVRESTLNQYKRLMNERTTFWVGTDGKVVAQVTAKDWETAKGLLDSYLDSKTGVGEEPGFRLARENLPKDATLLYLMETSAVLTTLVEQVKAAGAAIPGGLPPIRDVKPVKGDPTFVGVALTLKPQVATFDLFVPGTAMNVGTTMLVPLFRPID